MDEITFCELREKIVINIVDGKKLGHIIDISFSSKGKLLGLIVPAEKKIWWGTKNADAIFISYCNIVKIGADTILVQLN